MNRHHHGFSAAGAYSIRLHFLQYIRTYKKAISFCSRAPQHSNKQRFHSVWSAPAVIKGYTECHGANLAGRTLSDDFPMGRLSFSILTKGTGRLAAWDSTQDLLMALRHGTNLDEQALLFRGIP